MTGVDLGIGTIDTTLTAVDPGAMLTPAVMAAIVAAVRREFETDRRLDQQRRTDSALPGIDPEL